MRTVHRIELRLRLPEFAQHAQRLGGLGGVDPAHGEADMQQNPVADTGFRWVFVIDDADDVDLTSHAADLGGGKHPLRVVDAHDLGRNAETHGLCS